MLQASILRRMLHVLRNIWLKFLLIFRNACNAQHKGQQQQSAERLNGQQQLQPQAIPEVKGLPIVGTLFDFIAAGGATKLHLYVDQRHREFGPIFRERLAGGSAEIVFISSASLMRSVFLHEGQCPRHPLPDAWLLYNRTHNCQRGLFFMEGAEWLQNRRVLNRLLLSGSTNWLQPHIDACNAQLIDAWKLQIANAVHAGTVELIELEQQLYRWAIYVICTIMFGASACSCPQIESVLNAYSLIVHRIFESSAALMNFPPQLAKLLQLRIWTQFERNVSEVLEQGAYIIDMFVALCNDASETAQDTPVFEADSEALFNKLQQAGMSLAMIKRIFVDLVIAAGDTTAFTTEWALFLLAQDAALQQSIAKEAIDGAQTGPLVRGLLKETLRLYPVAPFIGRYLDADAVIDGYQLKQHTLVILSLYTAGRDAKHFSEPLAMRPERWQRDATTGELQGVSEAHATMPFAIGQRSCIGRKLATNQIQTLVTAIASNFELNCLNAAAIDCQLRMVAVPSAALRLTIKLREH